MTTRLVPILLLLFLLAPLLAETEPAPESQVQAALAGFVRAFDNLDWEAFRMAFSDDATVFYPRGFPKRASGRAEFEKTFKVVFDQIRGAQIRPPYMNIQPRDLDNPAIWSGRDRHIPFRRQAWVPQSQNHRT
jgi:hypothetical protein